MKTIAVITGASSGIGKQFFDSIELSGMRFDEIWVIARRADRLQELSAYCPVRPIALDLSDRSSFETYGAMLEKAQVKVGLLVNCSGFGKFAATMDVSLSDNLNMVDLNCEAVLAMCQTTIPHMQSGAKIVNVASVAAYQPIPYINVYGATKSFVLHFSRALNREMQKRAIHVMAVCPFWTKTEFFSRAIADDRDAVVKKYIAMYEPQQIVKKAWKDLARGKDVSMFGFKAQAQTLLAKILPHGLVMSVWMKQQSLD